jgi:hypothetical protein
MISRAEWARVAVVAGIVLAVANAPYVLAYISAPPDTFTGILFNTQDGHSYLAKMREGWRGEWLFTLPYTAEPGEGVFLFTYYLFLGHVARWAGMSLDGTYHLARLLGGAAFLVAAYRCLAHFFDTPRARLGAWLFFLGTSGLGWLALLAGRFTADLWVAESIPFLTLFSNAHFPPAWALMLLIIERAVLHQDPAGFRNLAVVALAVTALAIVQPMTLAPVNAVVAGNAALDVWQRRRFDWRAAWPAGLVAALSAPWVLYALWATNTHPVLSEWNRQNVTPSPAWWEALLWGGVVLGLAVVGAMRGQAQPLPARWLVIGIGLLYLPIDLQRRMSLGVWMPLSILAVWALRAVVLPRVAARWRPLLVTALVLPAALSNVVVVAATVAGVLGRKPELFLSAGEAAAMDWLAAQPGRPLVVASPDLALVLPGRSDARVIYGHPYETMDAGRQKEAVLNFLRGEIPAAEFLTQNRVDFVIAGPRERAINPEFVVPGWGVIFERGEVEVYGR